MTRQSIAIIGAGASGTLLSLHVLRHSRPNTRVTLIERNAPAGRGLAYATGNPNHLLNVPAGRMSAFADQPSHFLQWLQRQPDLAATEASFVPRRLYGAYLQDLLQTAMQNPALALLHDIAVKVDGSRLALASGRVIQADMIVLATGNDQPAAPCNLPALLHSPHWRADPWALNAFSALDPDAAVLLIGTGLTMVDAVISLLDQGHVGPIHAISRRGLLPHSHVTTGPVPALTLPTGLRNLTRVIRAETLAAGEVWRGVIDGLRPATQELWQALSLDDRRRFLRHLRPWWDVHRHRMAPAIATRIAAAQASGQLQVHKGRLVDCEPADAGLDVQFRTSGNVIAKLRVARVVNCSGPCTDVTRSKDPLLGALLRDRLVRPDACHLGLDATSDGALRRRDGTASHSLFAIGPLTRGMFWEITAIPDIRRQCESLALHLSGLLYERAQQRGRAVAYA